MLFLAFADTRGRSAHFLCSIEVRIPFRAEKKSLCPVSFAVNSFVNAEFTFGHHDLEPGTMSD
jgi:hypothetical protein